MRHSQTHVLKRQTHVLKLHAASLNANGSNIRISYSTLVHLSCEIPHRLTGQKTNFKSMSEIPKIESLDHVFHANELIFNHTRFFAVDHKGHASRNIVHVSQKSCCFRPVKWYNYTNAI